jgi:hypothetical protein
VSVTPREVQVKVGEMAIFTSLTFGLYGSLKPAPMQRALYKYPSQ